MGRPRKRRRDDEPIANGENLQEQAKFSTMASDTLGDPSIVSFLDINPHGSDLTQVVQAEQATDFLDPDFLGSGIPFVLEDLSVLPVSQQPASTVFENAFPDQDLSSVLNNFSNVLDLPDPSAECRCLSKLYLVLSAFQSSPPPVFPYSLGSLRKASKLASEVVQCRECVQEYNGALQNSMLLVTLLSLVISEYGKLLEHVEARAATDEKIPLRMGESSPGLEHLHTGTPDCPMGFDVEVDGSQWRLFARKVIGKEIHGVQGHSGLSQTLEQMKDRQVQWHAPHQLEHNRQNMSEGGPAGENCICVHLIFIDRLRSQLNALNI